MYPSPPAAAFLPLPEPPPDVDTILYGLSSLDLASEAVFPGDLPPSLLQPAFQGDLFTGSSPSSSTTVFGEPSPFSDYFALSNHLLHLYGFSASPPAVIMVPADPQELQQSPEPLLLSDDPVVQDMPAAVAAAALAVGDTTQLASSLTTFITNIVAAFSQLFSDLQAALTDNPALALLLLIPFLLLPFLYKRPVMYGGYHRRVYVAPHGRSSRDDLARRVLADLTHLTRLYGARSDALLVRLPSPSFTPEAH